MGRSILAVVAGLIVGGLIVAGIEYLGHIIYPPPDGLDLTNPEAIREFASAAPTSARLVVLLAWFLGPFGGGWLAARLATRSPMTHALIVGAFFLIGDLVNLITIPSPVWMWIGGLVAPPLAAYLAGRAAGSQAAVREEGA